MDPDLAHHLAEDRGGGGVPWWQITIAVGGWLIAVAMTVARALIGAKEATFYTKQEVDERLQDYVKIDDRREGCTQHMAICRDAHEALKHGIERHESLGSHAVTSERLARVEAEMDGVRERLDRIDAGISAITDKLDDALRKGAAVPR